MMDKKEKWKRAWNAAGRCCLRNVSFFNVFPVLLLLFAVTAWNCFWKSINMQDMTPEYHLVSENKVLQEGKPKERLKLYARGAALLDAENGRILYAYQEQQSMPMASTTKIMTCILALENGGEDDYVTISTEAAAQPPVKAGLRAGEQYRLKDLLQIMMLESYNDAAYAVGEHIGGSKAGFQKMMNDKAAEIGMKNSYFITPNGLDAEDENGIHCASAYDMALLGRYAMQNESFRSLVCQPDAVISDRNGTRRITASNKNAFLHQMQGAAGIKTGYTGGAGYCFVGAFSRDGKQFVSVVLGAGWPPDKSYKWKDTASLMQYGLRKYEPVTFNETENRQCRLAGPSESIRLTCDMLYEDCLVSDEDRIEEISFYMDSLKGDAAKGQILGKKYLSINGETVWEGVYLCQTEVRMPGGRERVLSLLREFLLTQPAEKPRPAETVSGSPATERQKKEKSNFSTRREKRSMLY